MYDFPEEVTFHPWVGSHYGSNDNHFGFRLLVLGESHYNNQAPNESHLGPDLTKEVVCDWKQGEKYPAFTKIANVLLGRNGGGRDEKTNGIWEHMAFYNYVSSCVPWYPDHDRAQRPTDNQWRESRVPFESALHKLEPNAVLMLGSDLSWWVKKLHRHVNFKENYQPYRHEQINFLGIYHPSARYFIYNEVLPAFKKLMELTCSR